MVDARERAQGKAMTDTITIDRTRFARTAELIREHGFWDGAENARDGRYCAGLALLQAEREAKAKDSHYVEMEHLARQLGYTGKPDGEMLDFVFGWNDRTGEAEVLDTLDKLARGEAL